MPGVQASGNATSGASTGAEWGAYTVDEVALRHGAGVERETTVPTEAYGRFSTPTLRSYPDGLLPD